MSTEHTINGVSVPNRVWMYEKQFDKTLRLGAHRPANSMTSNTRVSRGITLDMSDVRRSMSSDSRGSQLSSSRRLRKVTGRIVSSATASHRLGHNHCKQQQSSPFKQNHHAPPSAMDDMIGEARNAGSSKKWFTILKKMRPARFDDMSDGHTSDSPKPSTDQSVISEKEQPDTKRSRFGWPKRSRHNRPRNKLRKLSSPKKTAPDEVKQEERRVSKKVRKRLGLRRIRFKQSKQSLKAAAQRDPHNAAQEDFGPIMDRTASSGSLRAVIVDEAVVFEERDARARALAQTWLDSRKARPASVEEKINDSDQETTVTERSDATHVTEDAQPALTAVEKVQLEAATQRAEVKMACKSRFREQVSDSDDDDLDARDYSTLTGPYASRITEHVSRFLAPTNYRQELAVLNPDEPLGEEAQQRRDEVDNILQRLRTDGMAGTSNEDVIDLRSGYTSQTSRAKSGRCQLRRNRTIRRPRRLMSPIPEAESPVPVPYSPLPTSESSVSERGSHATGREHTSLGLADRDSDTASTSDYVSCRSSTSTPETERCNSAEEAIADIGIARTQSFTKVLEPNLKSVNVLRSKGKEHEERVDTPMTSPNGAPAVPDFQRDHTPWWEQTPPGPKVIPPKFACGPSVMVKSELKKEERERSRVPTSESGTLVRSMTTPARPRAAKKNSRGKRQSVGRPGIAADLEYKYQYDGDYVASLRRRAKSVSEEAVGVHLPVQEPVEIPREALERIVGGSGMSGL